MQNDARLLHLQSLVCGTVQDFYEDIFEEVDKYGEIEHLNICDNLADHMVGNVYIKFKWVFVSPGSPPLLPLRLFPG